MKVRRCLAGDGQGSGGAPGGVINPNAEVEREARLALNFGDRAKFPQGLSAEVEAFPHVRDLRLLGRVDQTALMQEAFDDGTNLVFQEFTVYRPPRFTGHKIRFIRRYTRSSREAPVTSKSSAERTKWTFGFRRTLERYPHLRGNVLCNSSSSPSSARFASCRREDYALRCSGFRREPSPTLDVYRWCRATGRRRQLRSPRHSPRSDWSLF